MRILSKQYDKSLLINCLPYMIITNKLPCAFNFRVISEVETIDEGNLGPGVSVKLAHMDIAFAPKVQFQTGSYQWSKLKVVNPVTQTFSEV